MPLVLVHASVSLTVRHTLSCRWPSLPEKSVAFLAFSTCLLELPVEPAGASAVFAVSVACSLPCKFPLSASRTTATRYKQHRTWQKFERTRQDGQLKRVEQELFNCVRYPTAGCRQLLTADLLVCLAFSTSPDRDIPAPRKVSGGKQKSKQCRKVAISLCDCALSTHKDVRWWADAL